MSNGLSSPISSSVSSSGNSSTRRTTLPTKRFSSAGIVASAASARASRSASVGGVVCVGFMPEKWGGGGCGKSLLPGPSRLFRLHAQGAVEADRLAVQHGVVDDVEHELCVFLGRAEAARERHAGGN